MVRVLINRPVRKQTMVLIASSGMQVSMNSTPAQFSYQDVAVYGTIEREGKKAITRKTAQGLRTLSFTHTVASLDYQVSIEPLLAKFASIAGVGLKVRFSGGSAIFEAPCWWTIKGMTVNVEQRALNNQPSRARLQWDLEESVDYTVAVSRVVPPKPPPKPAVKTPPPPAARTHRVVKGDTLWGIAAKYLGNGARWPEIVRLNPTVIKNPNVIIPGQLFKIPAR